MTVTVTAPAKINLWLAVGPLEPSGYHHLDTLFCALDLEDVVTLRSAPPGFGVRLEVDFDRPLQTPPDLGPPERNLAVRAAAAFVARAGLPADLHIHLLKRIPPGGGLGGGSSDAAAVLRALATAHPGAVPDPDLQGLAASLGSDVPFFLDGQPLARGRGRGTELSPAPALPSRPVVLVLPELPIATADAYRWLDEDRAAGRVPQARSPAVAAQVQAWADVEGRAHNDFETTVFHRHPVLQRIRDTLTDAGARPALLAGSGSSLFGVFEDDQAAALALNRVREGTATTLMTRTRTR